MFKIMDLVFKAKSLDVIVGNCLNLHVGVLGGMTMYLNV